MRVLLVKTSSMGDVLHTLPAVTDAVTAFPDIIFDWVVEENFAEIPRWHHGVNSVIPVAIRRWRKSWFHSATRQERQRFLQQLTEKHYDAVIDAQGLIKSALLITRHAKGIKHGYDRNSIREPLASFFYDSKHHVDKNQHAVERIRQLMAQSLHYPLPLIKGDYAIVQHFQQYLSADTGQYVVFLHATTREDKHWPEAHWQSLITQVGELGIKIKLPWGTKAEQERAERLAEDKEYVEVLPKSSLEMIACQLAGAKAVVSVDTGLSHLAAALDKPNITLYGPTDPGLIGGYGQYQMAYKISQQLSDIKPDAVFNQLLPLISS